VIIEVHKPLIEALINFDKPIVACGAGRGNRRCGWNYELTPLRLRLRRRGAQSFQMPFIDLAVVPEFGTSYSVPAR